MNFTTLRRYLVRVLGVLLVVVGAGLWIAGIGPGKTITVIGGFVVLLFGDTVRSWYLGQAIPLMRFAMRSFNAERYDDAADEAAECVQHLRKLGFARPADLKRLAPALSLQWMALWKLDRDDEARIIAEELVAVYRVVGQNYYERFYLADAMERLETSLSVLPADRVGTGADELMLVRAELADEANQKHARALTLVAERHTDLREYNAALPLLEQAVGVLRPLAAVHPGRRPALVKALTALGHCLTDLGDHRLARPAYAEAVDVARTLDSTKPLELASLLLDLAASLRELQQYDDAVQSGEAAVEILRAGLRSKDANDKAKERLASAVGLVGDDLSNLHRLEDALAAYREAVDVVRTAKHRQSRAAADALEPLIRTLRALGRNDEARPFEDDLAELQKALRPRKVYVLRVPAEG
ncbi:tetratricopeptide repeat protein [Kribbella pittospori]|nr:tetratricopeptide repeat protein [Kribbella pittospori]